MQTVSVIIPCRNGANYLGAALDSILLQRECVLEIVVVDDGSTDSSAEIARNRDGRVRVVQQAPTGLAAARQAGIKLARGSYLAFCDADDLWTQDRLPAQARFLDQDASSACCGLSQTFLTPELRSEGAGSWTMPPEYYRTFSSMLVKRSLFDRIGTLPENGADLHIPFFAALHDMGERVTRYEQVVTLRRVHAANYSRSGGPQFSNYARSLKGVLDKRRSMISKPDVQGDP